MVYSLVIIIKFGRKQGEIIYETILGKFAEDIRCDNNDYRYSARASETYASVRYWFYNNYYRRRISAHYTGNRVVKT